QGDEVTVLPGGEHTRVVAIDTFEGELDEAVAPMSVAIRLEDELDIARGELICHREQQPLVARELEADVCWMAQKPMRPQARSVMKHTTRRATAGVHTREDLLAAHTLERDPPVSQLSLNDIGRVRLRTSTPLVLDPYKINRRTGSFILIDEASNETVGAGMI